MNANGAPERTRPDTLNAVTVNQAFGYFLSLLCQRLSRCPVAFRDNLRERRARANPAGILTLTGKPATKNGITYACWADKTPHIVSVFEFPPPPWWAVS
jgi:hypothetical protein